MELQKILKINHIADNTSYLNVFYFKKKYGQNFLIDKNILKIKFLILIQIRKFKYIRNWTR